MPKPKVLLHNLKTAERQSTERQWKAARGLIPLVPPQTSTVWRYSMKKSLDSKSGGVMKKLVEVTEIEGAGMESLLGERVLLLCANYFYTGKLVGVNETCVELENPAIVYATGAWTDKSYADEQKLHVKTFFVSTSAIESFGVSK